MTNNLPPSPSHQQNRWSNEERGHRELERWFWALSSFCSIVATAAALGAAVFAAKAWTTTQDQVRITQQEAVYTQEQVRIARQEAAFLHRPHFRVRFARVLSETDSLFKGGTPVVVQLDILNNGQADAEIQASHLEVFWTNKGLPGYFPYVKPVVLNNFASRGDESKPIIPAGGGNPDVVIRSRLNMGDEYSDIESGRNGWEMYLLGWIGYRRVGDIKDSYNRFYDFALRFQPGTRRFLPVENDPDYARDPDGR